LWIRPASAITTRALAYHDKGLGFNDEIAIIRMKRRQELYILNGLAMDSSTTSLGVLDSKKQRIVL
jgi:hypothetical protein